MIEDSQVMICIYHTGLPNLEEVLYCRVNLFFGRKIRAN
ncbi:hypothetical protein Cylst_2838 [Cylindrospermum stagnale PCC 7417]|uniref:Uncharacterized protein n=1 Tax=Cylindrospermum stagnale PCC 7417 TaxID=56107 RepID=K9WZU9_9NOST|nr:hypothetical protein Cylst_2838 [Cylindrospermum stagnale PCC 7417]